MELKAGDVVMLKSGGQPLTVAEVKGDDILCLWMGMEGDLFRETLPLATLIQVEEDDEEEDDEDEDEDDE
ncbi:YodC family protein [Bradyrhizobium sp.]|uniref:YodC family protein n=1 Tax=Bradyrhizobium sp. TaxID=376 RepID=UPI0039E5DF44